MLMDSRGLVVSVESLARCDGCGSAPGVYMRVVMGGNRKHTLQLSGLVLHFWRTTISIRLSSLQFEGADSRKIGCQMDASVCAGRGGKKRNSYLQ